MLFIYHWNVLNLVENIERLVSLYEIGFTVRQQHNDDVDDAKECNTVCVVNAIHSTAALNRLDFHCQCIWMNWLRRDLQNIFLRCRSIMNWGYLNSTNGPMKWNQSFNFRYDFPWFDKCHKKITNNAFFLFFIPPLNSHTQTMEYKIKPEQFQCRIQKITDLRESYMYKLILFVFFNTT